MSVVPRRRTPAALLPRIAIIALLGALAGYLWFGDALDAESRNAARFCESVEPGTPAIGIMQSASRAGATGFATPTPDELQVAFGKATCRLPMRAGAFAGEPPG